MFSFAVMPDYVPWPFCIAFAFLGSPGIALILGSVLMNKWKFWAFENVRNVHELKRRTIKAKIFSQGGRFFRRLESCSEEDERYWRIRQKFERPDIFMDDEKAPPEKKIYFSKSASWILVIIFLPVIFGGLYFAIVDKTYIGFLVIIMFFPLFKELRKLLTREPRIILSNKGIQTASTKFYEWKEITDEDVVESGLGRTYQMFLIYKHPDGEERFDMEGIMISQEKMSNWLHLYRKRYEKT